MSALHDQAGGQVQWGDPMVQRSGPQGAMLHIHPLASRLAPAQLAQVLTAGTGPFQRVLTLPGRVVLSGLQDHWHWMADLERDHASSGGTAGYVSALHTAAAVLATDTREARPAWLPKAARPLFDHEETVSGRRMSHRIYQVPISPAEVDVELGAALRASGWSRTHANRGPGAPSAWTRRNDHLNLHVVRLGQGAAVLVQQLYTEARP